MNNEMDDFSKSPDSPNTPEPVKFPSSSMSPTIIEKDGEPFMKLGSSYVPMEYITEFF
jgi:gamma-glutamyltranspeptidase/glutathione hydrolase